MKREQRPSRLQWFAFDVDAFRDDPRMLELSPLERGAWAVLIINSFRSDGQIIVDDKMVSAATGLNKKQSGILLEKLIANRLIVPKSGNRYVSNRMVKEIEIAKKSYEAKRKGGINGMQSRYAKNDNSVITQL